jgi:magnesium transporter
MSESLLNNQTPKAALHIIHYDLNSYEESEIKNLSEINAYLDKPAVSWLDIDGTQCDNTIKFFTDKLNLHSLLVEDLRDHNHRPKIDEYDNHLFVMVKMLGFNDRIGRIKTEQVSFIVGKNYLISFQETGKKGDVFESIRTRLKSPQSRLRKFGSDYLLYALLDVIIDNYFVILEKIGEKIEGLESDIINQPSTEKLNEIYLLKRELIQLRRSVWPLREVISRLDKDDSDFISDPIHPYIRESYDHSIQVIETLESYRDILSGLIDIYLSSLSNKMNSVMKVLTVISTIFMPLTFIVGIYGMNFKNMPELSMHDGYYGVLVVCAVIVGVMLFYFKRKKWL